jgi:histidine triad (HIT) family protein
MPTLFEKIIAREIPADIVHEDDLCIAFRDIHPQAPVHVLLVPKKPIVNLYDASADDQSLLGHLLATAPRIAERLGLGDAFRLNISWAAGLSPGRPVDPAVVARAPAPGRARRGSVDPLRSQSHEFDEVQGGTGKPGRRRRERRARGHRAR